VVTSAEEANAAVADAAPEEKAAMRDDLGTFLVEPDSDPGGARSSVGPSPTTSLNARVVLTDHSEKNMWLQTAVVDRTGMGSEEMDDAAFVLEFRDHRKVNSLLHAQVEVSMIQSIEQLDPHDVEDDAAHASFVIKALGDANVGGSDVLDEGELWNVCHRGPEGLLTMYVVAGPSRWQRREAVRFFDELRIIGHFLSADAPPTPSTSMGSPMHHQAPEGSIRLSHLAGPETRPSLMQSHSATPTRGRLSMLLGR